MQVAQMTHVGQNGQNIVLKNVAMHAPSGFHSLHPDLLFGEKCTINAFPFISSQNRTHHIVGFLHVLLQNCPRLHNIQIVDFIFKLEMK